VPSHVFVCYHYGTGGERLSLEISRLPGASPLPHRQMGTRVFTRDLFHKRLLTPATALPHTLPRRAHTRPHVIPSHVDATRLLPHFPRALFVVIAAPRNRSEQWTLREDIYHKVWRTSHHTLAEKIGYYQLHGGGEPTRDTIKALQGRRNNAEIRCLIEGVPYTERNARELFTRLHHEAHTTRSPQGAVTIPYLHLRHRTDRFRSAMREIESRLKG